MADAMATAEFNFMKAVVVKQHNATDETQLELRLNDIVYVLEQDDSGWWGGHKEGEDCTGWFPGSCVRELDHELAEPLSEPLSMGDSPERQRGLSMVPEEAATVGSAARMVAGSAGCDAGFEQLDPALHHGNRLVASPSRRVSADGRNPAAAAASSDGAAALAGLQAEYTTIVAIAEDRAREIQRLQGELAEAKAATVSSARSQNEDVRRQCKNAEMEKAELQKKVQELSGKLERSWTAPQVQKLQDQIELLQEQLSRSQQETRSCMNESAQLTATFDRRLEGKEAELQESLAQCRQLTARSTGQAAGSASASTQPPRERELPPTAQQSACDDARRRLFASTAETTVLTGAASRPLPASSVPRFCGGGSERPLPARSNSLTRPAYRPLPVSSSPGAQSPGGLGKCRSVGDLPTPSRIGGDEEAPVLGSVKEKKAFFEQVYLRCGTPSRTGEMSNVSTMSDAPVGSARTPPVHASSRSASETRWAPNATSNPGLRQAASARSQFPGLFLPEVEEAAGTNDQLNLNMSPMKRNP
jgi:hypothetical protein